MYWYFNSVLNHDHEDNMTKRKKVRQPRRPTIPPVQKHADKRKQVKHKVDERRWKMVSEVDGDWQD